LLHPHFPFNTLKSISSLVAGPIDKNSGDQGGVAEGMFEFCWKGETLYAQQRRRRQLRLRLE
jgi:hypothetical protein